MTRSLFLMSVIASAAFTVRTAADGVWSADLGNGMYRNPILHADYSDPDAVRVGDDFWMTSSSFSHVPGLPILHSKDLVNWELVGHALPRLVPEESFAAPQPGKGVWAPSIRYHAGKFWIYYPDPDFGLYLITATDPRGPWTAPKMVKAGRGLIDPCPLWDDDGSVFLIHGWAKSRAGISNALTLLRLTPEGESVAEDLGLVIDGNAIKGYVTLEGPKLYKRDGWYYIFAPAGGVKTGWQSVFRSRSIRGPYEDRIVLAQSGTPINGPHQGALVDTPGGQWWFLHFQDKDAYGRVVHLQPVVWKDGWPVMGNDPDGDGKGEPVLEFRKPDVAAASRVLAPATSDGFDSPRLGLQWQWQANPHDDAYSLTARTGWLRLPAQPVRQHNLHRTPHLLLQKFPAPEFAVTVELDAAQLADASAGLVVFGDDYAWIGARDGRIVQETALHANETPKVSVAEGEPTLRPVFLRVEIRTGGECRFSYSADGKIFRSLGPAFVAKESRWVGAKVGLFADGDRGHADFDSFQVTTLAR